MFRWFAPLLLFAAKPEVLLRLLVAALAAAVLFFGVWLISSIAVTFDTLKNPAIAAIYGAVLLIFFSIVTVVAWLRLRRLTAPPKAALPQPVVEAAPLSNEIVSKRAKELVGKWDAENRSPPKLVARASVAPVPAPVTPPSRQALAALIVTGPAYAGKSALIEKLVEESRRDASAATGEVVQLKEGTSIDGDERRLEALVASAKLSDGVLFVVDQDLRAPEVAAITRFLATRKPLYLVLNKADQFNSGDRDAVVLSIRAKLPSRFPAAHLVCAAAAPMPVEREIEDARGAVRVEVRRPSSDVTAVTTLLRGALAPHGARALRYERAP
jgi:GTP-binding protein EngB required for normal cell division